MVCVMVAMLFLLTACVSSDTSGEKENTKGEGVEDSNSESMIITLDTSSDSEEEKKDKNTTDTVGNLAEEKNYKNTLNTATGMLIKLQM